MSRLLVTSCVLVTWSSAVVPRLPPAPATRTAANLVGTAVLVRLARRDGLRWTEVWGDAEATGRGVRAGGASLAATLTGYGLAVAVPPGRRLLPSTGAGHLRPAQVAVRAGLLVPLGTVLCEEVAFRGVLHALAERVLPPAAALAATSLVFGLWHVGSARHPVGPPEPVAVPVAGVVAATTAAGLLLGGLRRRTGSLLAPLGLHLGANGVGLVAAAVAGRLPR